MKKFILRYGITAGIFLAAFLAISMYFASRNSGNSTGTGEIIGFSAMISAMGICMWMASSGYMRETGDRRYLPLMWMNLGIGIIASLFYLLGWALTYKFIYPDFVQDFMDSLDRGLQSGKVSKATYDEYSANMKLYDQPVYFILFTLMEIVPVAVPLALLVSFITRLANKSPQR